jgi:hypothetical protein
VDFRQLILERDGTTPCFARIGGTIGAVLVAGLAALQIAKGQTVDLVQFSLAWTTLTVGTAGAARLKLNTEGPGQ